MQIARFECIKSEVFFNKDTKKVCRRTNCKKGIFTLQIFL